MRRTDNEAVCQIQILFDLLSFRQETDLRQRFIVNSTSTCQSPVQRRKVLFRMNCQILFLYGSLLLSDLITKKLYQLQSTTYIPWAGARLSKTPDSLAGPGNYFRCKKYSSTNNFEGWKIMEARF